MPTRRDFLTTLGAALGTAALGRTSVLEANAADKQLSRIGIQLYTLRALMAKDVEGTLARVAKIGYREVEFHDYFGRKPQQIRKVLSSNRLTSPSAHFPLPATDDGWMVALADARAIGHKWAVIPWIDAGMRKTPDDWKKIADRFNHLAAKARTAGMRFAYHNHAFEFERVGDGTALDLLLSKTDPALVDFEMDIYWVVKGGGDPLTLIERHPRRFPLMHVKDATTAPALAMTDVGSGTIDFAKIFARVKASGMRHVYVEHDEPPDPWQTAINSYQYLAALRY